MKQCWNCENDSEVKGFMTWVSTLCDYLRLFALTLSEKCAISTYPDFCVNHPHLSSHVFGASFTSYTRIMKLQLQMIAM